MGKIKWFIISLFLMISFVQAIDVGFQKGSPQVIMQIPTDTNTTIGNVNVSAGSIWFYNQTTPAISYTNDIVSGYNSSWITTYNATYDNQFSFNNTFICYLNNTQSFTGSNNFTNASYFTNISSVDRLAIGDDVASTASLFVTGDVAGISPLEIDHLENGIVGAVLRAKKARGNMTSPRRVLAGDTLGGINTFGAYQTNDTSDAIFPTISTGLFRFLAGENFNSSNQGTYFTIQTASLKTASTSVLRLTVNETGLNVVNNVVIGSGGKGNNLSISGMIRGSENITINGTYYSRDLPGITVQKNCTSNANFTITGGVITNLLC